VPSHFDHLQVTLRTDDLLIHTILIHRILRKVNVLIFDSLIWQAAAILKLEIVLIYFVITQLHKCGNKTANINIKKLQLIDNVHVDS